MSKDNTNIVLEINDASKNITSMDSVEENLSNNILVMLNPKQTPLEQYKEMLDQYTTQSIQLHYLSYLKLIHQ